MEKKFTEKISTKVLWMSVLMAMVICFGCCVCGFLQYRNYIYEQSNNFAYEIGSIARSFVDGDSITSYLETGETDAAYDEMAQNIYNVYRNTDLYDNQSGIFICLPDCEEYTLTNIFDVRILEAENKEPYAIGVVDPMASNPDEIVNIFKTGELSDDYFIHETDFGYNSSAILPIFNSSEEVVALIVADMPIPYITQALAEYLLNTIIITLFIVAIFMCIFIALINRTITRPITKIAQEAQAFTDSDIQVSEKLLTFKQKDEIGQLADSIYHMEKDIKQYVENITYVTAEKERIGAELNVATNIQLSMLPCIFPAFPERKEFDIFASMNPAKEVGGDFYDFFMVDDRHLAIVVADVSGKGVPAALFMVIGKTLIKDHTESDKELNEVFEEVNNMLCESNSEGLFITAFEGVLDLVTGEFRFVNAGHETPFIAKKGQAFAPHKIRAGFVLAGMEDMMYKGGSVMLEPGDKVFQYTDGVTEATRADDALYGMERLEAVLGTVSHCKPDEILPAVKADIDRFVGDAPQFDDITMLCLEYKERMVIEE